MNHSVGRLLSQFATAILLLFCGLFAFAGPTRTTYQAKIVKPDGYPLEASSVNFKFTILDPAGACVLFSETYSSVNMSSTGGLISFALGSGVKTYPVSATTFEQVFSNITPNLSCEAGGPPSYSPLSSDTRKIVMQFHDGGGWQTLPAMTINAVPYAMYANEASKLNGKTDADFVEVAALPTCLSTEALRFNGTSFSCINTATVSAAAVAAALGYTPADSVSVTALTSSLSTTNSTLALVSSTIFSVSSTVSSLANSVSALTSSQWLTSGTSISYSTGQVGIGTSSPTSLLHLYSDTTAFQQLMIDAARNGAGSYGLVFQKSRGNSSLRTPALNNDRIGEIIFQSYTDGTYPGESAKIRVTAAEAASSTGVGGRIQFMTTAVGTSAPVERVRFESDGNVGIGITNPVTKLDVSGGVRISMEAAACAVSFAGTLRYNSGLVEYCNGTSWSAFGVAGAGITLLNGSASGTQSFVTGITGTNFNITSNNGVHSFNIPLASSAAVTAGLLSNADYAQFSNKVSATSASVISALGYAPASATAVTNLSINTAASFAAITSSQWVTSASAIYYNNGYVGIGTSSPLSRLTVANVAPDATIISEGANSITLFGAGHAYFQGRDVTNGVEYIMGTSTVGNEVFAGSMSDHNFSLRTGNSKRIMMTASGAVGVGVNSPTAKLHIAAGTVSMPALKLNSSTLVSAPQSGSIEYDGTSFYVTDATDTRRAIATTSAAGTYDNATNITASGNISLTPTGSVIVSSTTASTNSTTGALVVRGGLGVAGNIYSSGTIITSSNIQGVSLTATAGIIAPFIYGGTGAAQDLRLESTTNAVKGNVLIGSGGNIGMGTNQPLAKLYVDSDGLSPSIPAAGTVAVFDNESSDMNITLMTSSSRKASLFFANTNMTSRGAISYQFNPTASLDKLSFDVNSGTRMVLDATGRMGVGTSTPTGMVNIVNSADQDSLLIRNYPSQTAYWLRVNDSSGTTRAFISPNSGMPQFSLGVTNAIRLTAEYGGIHDVPAGAAITTSGNLSIMNSGNPGVKTVAGYWNGSYYHSAWEIANPAAGYGSLLLMKSGGTVGVGVTSATARLHIASGSTTAAAIKITSGTLLTTPQAGAIEYDGFKYYITDGSNTRRAIASDNNTNFNAGNIVASGSLNLTNGANLYLTAAASDPGDIIFQEASGTQKGRIWSDPTGVGLFLSSGDTTPDITINAAGNVGIGTQFPTEKLEVSGAIKIPGVGQIGPAGGFGYAMYVPGTNNFVAQMYGAVSGIQFTNSVGADTLFISENGRLGLGISSPTALVNIVGTDSYNNLLIDSPNYSALTARGGATSGWPLVQLNHQGAGGKSWNIEAGRHTPNSFGIYDTVSGVTRLAISSIGNIGIGNTAPTTALQIGTAIYMGEGGFSGSAAVGSDIRFSSAGLMSSDSQFEINIDADNNSTSSYFSINKDSNVSSATELFRVQENGYVGIGASAPAQALDVIGTIKFGADSLRAGHLKSVGSGLSPNPGSSAFGAIVEGANEGHLVLDLKNNQTNDTIAFRYSAALNTVVDTVGLVMNGSGNVGIGSSVEASMTAKLNVVGSSGGEVAQYIHNTNPAGYAVLRMNNNWGGFASGTALHSFGPGYGTAGQAYAPSTTTLTAFESGGLNLHASTGPLRFFANGNLSANNHMLLSTAGNLGIGTSVPAVKAHVYGQVDGPFVGLAIDNRKTYGAGTGFNETARMIFSLSEQSVANVNDRVMGYIEGGTISETSSADTFMAFGTRSGGPGTETEKMRISHLGNIGIGTSSPAARLNISGLGAANATALRIDSQDTYYRDILMSEFNTTTHGGIIRYHSGLDLLQLITLEGSVEKYGVAVARATGFVGIGRNSAAAYQLDVSGSVRVTGEAFRDDGVATWAMTSDSRLKDVVSSYDRGLKEILDIDTIIFKYKKDNPKKLNSTKEFPGVIAQQVQKVIPEAVDTDKDGFLSLNTTPIIWAMLNAIKEVYHKIEAVLINDSEQDREIASLKKQNEELKAYLCEKDPKAPICK